MDRFNEEDMDFMGGETNEFGEWTETDETIYEAQVRELTNYLAALPVEELSAANRFVESSKKKGDTITKTDIEYFLMLYREGKVKGEPEKKTLSSQLSSASPEGKEKILEGAGLYSSPRKHYFEGKPYPTATATSNDRIRAMWNSAERPEKRHPSKTPVFSRGQGRPVPQIQTQDLNSRIIDRKLHEV